MSKVNYKEDVRELPENFRQAPLVLRAFIIFSALATLSALLPITPGGEIIVPYTGWILFVFYMGALKNALGACSIKSQISVYWILGDLLFLAAFGVIDWLLFSDGVDFGNPYLAYSPLRPLFTIALPLLWIFLIGGSLCFSDSMKRWVKKEQKEIAVADFE